MESLQSSFISSASPQLLHSIKPHHNNHNFKFNHNPTTNTITNPNTIRCSVSSDPWTLSDGNHKPKPRSKNPKNPLSDDNARRIIKSKARYLSTLRRNQGPQARTPEWVKRTPEQMVQYLQDDRNGHLYGKHVVAAIKAVRSLSQKPVGSYDMRSVMSSFVAKLTFREMCVVLKEQKGWRQISDFFHWMKLQLCYHPSVIAYTIVLRAYGQVGKIQLAEETFLEMLEAGCEPDEIACGTMLCTYARWGRHKAMLAFYLAVKERGVLLTVAVYNFMLSSLQKKSLHQNVIQIYTDMVDNRVVANHFTYTLVICSYVKQGFLEDALTVFNRMKSLGFVPEEVTYSLLITLNVKKGKQDEALRLYEDMWSLNLVPSNFTCASLLNLYHKNGDYPKAISLLSEMQRFKIQADEVIYGLLVKIYGKLGLYEDAERTFEEADRLGLLSDEKTFIAMARVFLTKGDFAKVAHTMEMMKSRNIPFSKFAYSILLKCYVMKGDLISSEATFQDLSSTGPPDTGSCRDILNLYLRQELFRKAENFIFRIRKENVVFDEELCRMVMKVYSKGGMLREAEQFIEEIKRTGSLERNHFVRTVCMILNAEGGHFDKERGSLVAPSLLDTNALELLICLYLASSNDIKAGHTLDILLNAVDGLSIANQLIGQLIRKGDTSKAEILLDLLSRRDATPQVGTLASMISLYGKQQNLHSVKQIFTSVAGSAICGAEIYNAVIDACIKCGEPKEAYGYFKESRERGINLSPVVISVLVNSLTYHGMHLEAEDVMRRSFRDDFVLDTVAYNTFIKAMLEAGKLHFAGNIYERMLSAGVSPSIQTYSTMISVYGRQRKYEEAVKIFDTAQSSGIPLDEKVYTNLISIYGKSGKIEEASALFSEMRKAGIQPGKISYNVMMNAYAAAGLHSAAEELFKAMLKDNRRPDSLTYLALMKAYTEGRKYQEAESLVIEMQEAGTQPSSAHLNLLISAFAKAGLVKDASRIFDNLLSSGLQPDLVCYRTLMRSYLDYGYVNEGIVLFERIQACVEPDRFILSAAVQLYKYTGLDIRAEGILKSMNSLGIPFLRGLEVGAKASS